MNSKYKSVYGSHAHSQNTNIILAERAAVNFVANTARRLREDRKRNAISLCHKSFYRFGIRSCLATSDKQFGFPGNTASHLGSFYSSSVYLNVGESQSISGANNSKLQRQQCPTGQVAGNRCRGRFNTERMVTWTAARAAKKKTSPLIERPI